MVFILLVACLSVCLAGLVDDAAWQDYKLEFGKVYAADEDAARYETWLKNMIEIDLHNADYSKTYTQGPNQFTDMTDEEFQRDYSLTIPEEVLNGSWMSTGELFQSSLGEIPDSVNWVEKGHVTKVKDQSYCGSCYAFAAVGALEAAWFKKHKKLTRLSEQQIVDCSGNYGNAGCQGGWYAFAWDYVRHTGGSQTEESYPYESRASSCRFNRQYVAATLSKFEFTEMDSEDELTRALAEVGPIAVSIVSTPAFRRYKSGVFYDISCLGKSLDHAVLAVGYGTENGNDYYLVKNSWGDRFGLGGYIKMSRNRGNNCYIARFGAYPVL